LRPRLAAGLPFTVGLTWGLLSPGARGTFSRVVRKRTGRASARPVGLVRFELDCYQLLLEQPPLLPPDTAQERVVVPSEAFVIVKEFPDFECATTA
jgi:hypothetical protein